MFGLQSPMGVIYGVTRVRTRPINAASISHYLGRTRTTPQYRVYAFPRLVTLVPLHDAALLSHVNASDNSAGK